MGTMSDTQPVPGGEAEQEPQPKTPAEQVEERIRNLRNIKVSRDLPWMHQAGTHFDDGTQITIIYTQNRPQPKEGIILPSSEFFVQEIFPDKPKIEHRWPAGSHAAISDSETVAEINKLIDALEAKWVADEQKTEAEQIAPAEGE